MKLFFVVSDDRYFWSHRRWVAFEALKEGWEVHLVAENTGMLEEIVNSGITMHAIRLRRTSVNFLLDLQYIARLIGLYLFERPDIVHHVAMKPVLYGAFAACLTRVPCVVNALAGMGYLFTSDRPHIKAIKRGVIFLMRPLFGRKNSMLVVQNSNDLDNILKFGVSPDRIRMIRGSGVDVDVYCPGAFRFDKGKVKIIMASRLLFYKGVLEFLAASKILVERGLPVKCAIAGKKDLQSPNAVPEDVLKRACDERHVELLADRDDVNFLYKYADIAVVSSYYREGIPKALIEAAACGLPIVATDIAGCREVVEHGVNGFLVPARDEVALADAIEKLVRDPELRAKMGKLNREKAELEFSVDKVVEQTMSIYKQLHADVRR